MKKREKKIAFDHSGSSFDGFLEEEGIREEVEAVAIKRVLAWQLSQEMHQQKKTKQAMARDLQTSRSQLDRLLDPHNVSVSLDTMARAARVLGKSLVVRISDRKLGPMKPRGRATLRTGESREGRYRDRRIRVAGRRLHSGVAMAASIEAELQSPGANSSREVTDYEGEKK